MYKLCFCSARHIKLSVLSLFCLLLFIILGFSDGSFAQGLYSAAEQIYLKKSTPILYEFSQAASEVSVSVLPLQSAPPEQCSAKFADYRGIIDSLAKELESMTPPPKLESVHEKSMQALTGYSSGLELYYKACAEKDYGVKDSLVSQGGVYLKNSVATIGMAYDELESIKSERIAAAKLKGTEEIREGELPGAGMSGDNAAERYGAKGIQDNSEPRPEKVKSKEEVIKEISEQVETKNETQVVKQAKVAIPVKRAIHEPPHSEDQSVVSQTVTNKEEVQTKALQPAEPLKTAAPEVQQAEGTDIQQQNAEAANEEKGTEGSAEPEKKISDKERVEKLNKKIMEQAGKDQGNAASQNPETGGSEISPSAAEEHQDLSPAAAKRGETAAENTPQAGNSEVAAAPPGGVPDEVKEEKGLVDDIKSWCLDRNQTPSDQESCMKSRALAKEKTQKLMNKYTPGSKERKVFDKCVADWKEGDSYNYEMIISCTQFYCNNSGIESCKDLSK